MATRTVPPRTPAEHATINTTRCCIEKNPPEKPRMHSKSVITSPGVSSNFVSKFNHMMWIQTKLTGRDRT